MYNTTSIHTTIYRQPISHLIVPTTYYSGKKKQTNSTLI